MLATSYHTFPANLAAGAVDQYGGAIIEFRITGETAAEALKKGISGATIATNDGKESVPVAMTLRIKSNTTTLRAMRYDYIKERFASAEVQSSSGTLPVPSRLSIPYTILGITNTPMDGDTGATGLQSASGCWRSKATPGARTVDLTINVNATTQRIKAVRVVTAPCGSIPLKYWVDQRIKEDAPWEYVTACEQPADSSVDCRIDLATPRQLRFRFDARTPVAINALLLQ
ncbi:hypothetical protein FVW20_05020 [Desulfovibrio oxamicus]|uniref:DUF3108 domain-containing protein n=1 Tax=Nitratidesulfovibrio oxamicus TaxID=32016 RepID=A0ABS0J1X3_9BACT|nr:hypothetical protein [Nitratidesulfovibrio oxamicus]MBG3876404.1 hypothetical protein [Nitratidesulfovibrio oxamicus]